MHLPPQRIRSILVLLVLLVAVILSAASLHRQKQRTTVMTTAVPPIAARRPFEVVSKFSTENIIDPYHWLRDDSRSNNEVRGYLEAENSYADTYFARLQQQVAQLESDLDAPHPDVELSGLTVHGSHLYYRKRGPGDDYWATYRRPLLLPPAAAAAGSNGDSDSDAAGGSLARALAAAAAAAAADGGGSNGDEKEELVLDENDLAAEHSYWDAAVVATSPDGSRVAVAFDTRGDECYSLQVFDVASGAPLLQPAISGCAGDAVWWGDSSEVLVFTTEDEAVSDRSRHLVNCLLLPPAGAAAQQQQAAGPAGIAARSLLLYAPGPDERRLSLAVTRDRRFLLLTSSVDGGTLVQALPTSRRLATNITSSSTGSSDSSSPAEGDDQPIVPASDWQVVVSPDDDLDVLRIDHVGLAAGSGGCPGTNSSIAAAGAAAAASSGEPGGSVFLAIVDDDESPDGELLLIDTRQKERRMEVLVRNRRPPPSDSDDSDSDDSSSNNTAAGAGGTDGSSSASAADSGAASTAAAEPPSSHPPQQQPQQSLQITDFAVHAAAGIVAVLVRRGGCCSVQLYSLPSASSNATCSSPQPQQQQQQQQVPVVVLQTESSNSSSSSNSTTCAAAAAADAQAAAGSSTADAAAATAPAAAAASLDWVLAPQDATLLLQLEGVLGPAEQPWLLLEASGIVVPSTLFAINLLTRQCVKVHQEEVVGFVPGRYAARLEWAASAGGAAVPVTVAFQRDLLAGDGSNRAILHGYGAYGANKWPSFDPADLALLDRGLVIAWAHVRGGGELGSAWHIDAQRLRKKNTFYDFLTAARHLISNGYTSHQHLAVWGRSAGGLTVGASLNMEPSLAAVALLDVPFLDVLATMSDPELPLTIKERHEWGDPLSDKAAYAMIRSYTPTLNISPTGRYPALLLTASLNDGRVNYWEPAKFTAAIRHLQQQQQQQQGVIQVADQAAPPRPVVFVTDMHAGHFAASAASSRLTERARKVAFILDNLGLQ